VAGDIQTKSTPFALVKPVIIYINFFIIKMIFFLLAHEGQAYRRLSRFRRCSRGVQPVPKQQIFPNLFPKYVQTDFLSSSSPSSPRNTSAISRLRSSTPLPRPTSRKKVESFVNFALNKYQSTL